MKIIVSSAGRFHAVHLAKQLEKLDHLKHFFSAGLSTKDFNNFAPKNLSFNWLVNFLDRVYVKFSGDRLISPSRWYTLRDGLFDLYVSHEIKKKLPCDLFVGWANCSLKSMVLLHSFGIKTVLESGSMHIKVQEHILRTEYEKWGVKFSPVVKQNKEKMLAEYELADRICVPSSHVQASFIAQGIPAHKIIKVPYGIDFEKFGSNAKIITGKFKLIFVGQISLQKGILYLLNAWQQLKLPATEAELVLVGNLSAECRAQVLKIAGQNKSINLVGPVPHAKIKTYLAQGNAFVLPSLQEGLAMVLGEAMAAGLPIIATTHTGAQELITHGTEGFLVPPCDPEALAGYIQTLFLQPELAAKMGNLAQKKAQTWSWADYGLAMAEEYKKILTTQITKVYEHP